MHELYGVIWDVDGTLVDTAELHYRSWVDLARERGLPFGRDDFERTFGRRNPEIIRLFWGDHLTDAEVAELGERKEELYRAEARQGVALLAGVEELLAGLHEAGFKQGVGSSGPRRNLDLIFELTGTTRYFSSIVSMEDTRRGKPDPEVFLIAARQLGLPPSRCLVLEDAVAGVQAARRGGMKCIAVTFVGHHSPAALRDAGADLVVANLQEVDPNAVKQLLDDE